MARNGLTDRVIKQARRPGVLIDGAGLRLRVTANPNSGDVRKSWIVRVTVKDGPVRELGLGSAELISLKDAREAARRIRQQARAGVDPLAAKEQARARKAAEAALNITFRQCAEAFIAAHAESWRNDKHRRQWGSTLENYAYPVLGASPVRSIDQAMIMNVLDPIWSTKTETASRLRGRIEAVLDWAAVRGYRDGDNPARWRGHLQRALPSRDKVRRVRHYPALAYSEIPKFVSQLRMMPGVAARALEVTILTAARSSESLNASWREFDLREDTWTIPGARMKSGREHRVPLSHAASALIHALGRDGSYSGLGRKSDLNAAWLFPGAKKGRPLSNMAMLKVLERMGRKDLTAHGFRSTFRDWVAEQTDFPGEVAEAALAHVVGDKVEAAYRRGDLFEKRRKLMEAWAAFCLSAH